MLIVLYESQIFPSEFWPVSPVPVNLGGLGGIQQETTEMGKKGWRKFSPARKYAQVQIIFSAVLFGACKVYRLRAGRVRSKWYEPPFVAAPRRLSDSVLALRVVQGSPALLTPAAAPAPAEAIFPVAWARPVGEMAISSCPSRAAAGRGPTVGWPLIAARVRAWAGPGPRPRPSPEDGRLPNVAEARPPPQFLGPGARPGWGAPRPPASSARPVYLPARGLSARDRNMDYGSRPPHRMWARRPVRVGRSLPAGSKILGTLAGASAALRVGSPRGPDVSPWRLTLAVALASLSESG